MTVFEYVPHDPRYAATFHNAMVSYSAAEAFAVREELRNELTGPAVFCDVGGGYGYLLAELLRDRRQVSGIVFDLPQVTAEQERHVTRQEGLSGRCAHIAGDMFVSVPEADVYLLKHILHDWDDEECQRILSVVRKAAKPTTRLFICEFIVSDREESIFAKIVDIAMLCLTSGRERTVAEYTKLLSSTGWAIESTRLLNGPLVIIEAAAR
jgi:SAM-dependent methyltransferase